MGQERVCRLGYLSKISYAKTVLKKKGRRSFDEISRDDDHIAIIKWMDNRPVIMASSCHGSDPVIQVKRYCRKEKDYIDVPRPYAVGAYNHNMGGVDLYDRMLTLYRIATRTKK